MGKDDKELEKGVVDAEINLRSAEEDSTDNRVEKVLDVLQKTDGEALGNYIENDKEAKAELSAYQQKVEKILEGGKEKIDSEIIGRAQRDIYFADEVEKMAQGEEFNNAAVAGVLERRMWGSFFNNLKKGDTVVSFLVPGADFLSIKNLNDKIFGPQVTNRIIEEKRHVLERNIKEVDSEAVFLQSDYKTEVVKVSQDAAVDYEDLMAKVDQEMREFITKITTDLLKTEQSTGKIKVLNEFLDDLHGRSERSKGKEGFKMNYGLAMVEGDTNQDQLLALDHALQTSRIAREAKDGSYGAEYSETKNLQEVENIKNLRTEIIDGGNRIVDADGNEFEVFSKKDAKFVLNRDLLRDVRKGKFKTDDKSALEKISLYVKKLNILDVVKPFVEEELAAIKNVTSGNHELAVKIKAGERLTDSERKQALEILQANEKDKEYTANSEFHKRATEMNDAAYVSLDVLDLGVDLLLEYESGLQEIEAASEDKKAKKFNEVSLSAGDETTLKLREFRKKVAEVYRQFGLGDDLVVGEIGGDELTLAVDIGANSVLSEKGKMEEFLFALKEATNTRVIKTVVSQAEKHIDKETNSQAKVEAHLEAMKRAEEGAAIAKDLEEAARRLTLLLKREGEEAVKQKLDGLSGVFVSKKGKLEANFVIVENGADFKITNAIVDVNYRDVKKDLDIILGRSD